jgi:CRP-like cAMP-binding protein
VLTNSFLTKHLSRQDLTALALAMQKRTYNTNENIITYGDFGNEYFILDQGVVIYIQ